MLTDPIKFYEYFQIAHNQLQISSKGNISKSKEVVAKAESKKDPAPPSKTLNEFDDLTVFLLTIP